jgi:isoquinoline 1-oxidoreductase subunit beta
MPSSCSTANGAGRCPAAGARPAVHRSFLTYVAAIAQVAVENDGRVTVPRIDFALDCGLVVNRGRVRARLEGAAIMGIYDKLFSNITVKQGRIEQRQFR